MSVATPSRVMDRLREVAAEAVASRGMTDAPGDAALARLRACGTELWLDTGNLEEAQGLWRSDFTALTTNNTLANQVVQSGVLDAVIRDAARDLKAERPGMTDGEFVMELGFLINCHIALRLVKAFGVKVSVELHPSVSEDMDRTVEYAERYFAVCPERFIIKIPLTPEGYCAVARVRAKGIPVNYTLGFSARQNYLAALLSQPTYCNVFLGRLNAVISDNGLGDGRFVGEKTTIATQRELLKLREAQQSETRLIAASMRGASQVFDLAGVDVYTMPPKVAKDFLAGSPNLAEIENQTAREFPITLNEGVDATFITPLWTVNEATRKMAEELAARGGAHLTGNDLRAADRDFRTGLFHRFTSDQAAAIRADGKIPVLSRWMDSGIALDDLMTQSALQSFTTDQAALDDHLREIGK